MPGKKRKAEDEEEEEEYKESDDEEEENDDEEFKDDSVELVDEEKVEKDEETAPPPKKKAKKSEEKEATPSKKAKSSPKAKKSEPKKKESSKKSDSKKDAKKDGKKAALKSVSDAEDWLLEYLTNQNRPFTIAQLIDLSQGLLKKKICTDALDNLVGKDEITQIVNKKTKLFFVNQEKLEKLDEGEIKALRQKNKDTEKEISELKNSLVEAERKLSHFQGRLTHEEIEKQNEELEKKISEKETRLHDLKTNVKLVDKAEKEKVLENMEKYKKEWKKRKHLATEIMNQIADSAGNKPSEMIEEFGIETDEEAGVSLADLEKNDEN